MPAGCGSLVQVCQQKPAFLGRQHPGADKFAGHRLDEPLLNGPGSRYTRTYGATSTDANPWRASCQVSSRAIKPLFI